MIISNRYFFFVTKIISIIEFEIQSIFRQNFQYWQFRINISIIFDFWKVFKNYICLFNELTWIFVICDKINNISNSNFKSVFQISHIFVQYFDKKLILKLFVFSKSLRNHVCFIDKRFCFFRLDVEFNIFSVKNDKNFLTKFCINIWYWIYSLCRNFFQSYIQLLNKLTFFSCFCDVFNIR